MAFPSLQTIARWRPPSVEAWLEAERDQLPLWIPVAFGLGIAAWFALPDRTAWIAFLLAGVGVAIAGVAFAGGGRLGRAAIVAGCAMVLGMGSVWWRAEHVASPVLGGPAIVTITARVERIDPLAARGVVRLRLAPIGGAGLPARIRVNLPEGDVPDGLAVGATLRLRARLMPPAAAAVPHAYDFSRAAWFDGLGATGRAFAPVEVIATTPAASADLRARLSRHIRTSLPGAEGAVAASLATGDQGAIPDGDAEAMRRSGLAHLLSVSGLHITAAVGAAMFVALRLMALNPWAALHLRLPLVAAGVGAVAAIGYTWLTGGEVPTIRSCVAALLVLGALMLGREAVTLRLVAVGALVVLVLWPQALVGASFQLSFAAVTAIVALHESAAGRRWFAARDEGPAMGAVRGLLVLLATGLIVELALIPIGLFHFHKAGAYGALANIVAIPLTTFVVMPLEAVALLLDPVGLGWPFWWLAGKALTLLLVIARTVAAAPGAVAALPAMPRGAYGLMVGGGLWIALWRTRARWLGAVPVAVGAVWALTMPLPDVIVTGDGRHLAIRTRDGGMAVLRERAGDYVRDLLAEGGGVDGELSAIDDVAGGRCNADLCLVRFASGHRLLATRSGYHVDALALIRLCRTVDIVVSDRTLPRSCTPRWLKLDRRYLRRSGGVSLTLAPATLSRVADAAGEHPWVRPETVRPPRDPSSNVTTVAAMRHPSQTAAGARQ